MRSFTRDSSRQTGKNRSFTRNRKEDYQKPSSPGKGNFPTGKLVIVLALMAIVVAGGYLIYTNFYTAAKPEQNNENQLVEDISIAGYDILADEEDRNILHISPPFTVNLSGLDGKFVINVVIWLEVDNMALVNELNSDVAKFNRIVDDIVKTIKSWTYAELTVSHGLDRLKIQLRDHINSYLESGQVVQVLFNKVMFTEILPRPRR